MRLSTRPSRSCRRGAPGVLAATTVRLLPRPSRARVPARRSRTRSGSPGCGRDHRAVGALRGGGRVHHRGLAGRRLARRRLADSARLAAALGARGGPRRRGRRRRLPLRVAGSRTGQLGPARPSQPDRQRRPGARPGARVPGSPRGRRAGRGRARAGRGRRRHHRGRDPVRPPGRVDDEGPRPAGESRRALGPRGPGPGRPALSRSRGDGHRSPSRGAGPRRHRLRDLGRAAGRDALAQPGRVHVLARRRGMLHPRPRLGLPVPGPPRRDTAHGAAGEHVDAGQRPDHRRQQRGGHAPRPRALGPRRLVRPVPRGRPRRRRRRARLPGSALARTGPGSRRLCLPRAGPLAGPPVRPARPRTTARRRPRCRDDGEPWPALPPRPRRLPGRGHPSGGRPDPARRLPRTAPPQPVHLVPRRRRLRPHAGERGLRRHGASGGRGRRTAPRSASHPGRPSPRARRRARRPREGSTPLMSDTPDHSAPAAPDAPPQPPPPTGQPAYPPAYSAAYPLDGRPQPDREPTPTPTPSPALSPAAQQGSDRAREALLAVRREVGKAVVGQDAAVSGVIICLLVRGHVLLEGVPGVAKTLLVRAVAKALAIDTKRVQFTPDLMPGDITGSLVYDNTTSEFVFREGPVFTNLLLADEINRTPPKTQASLLEAMEERQVSVDGRPRPLPQPFLVAATQNPVEYEGTYPLPEAQLDRFLLK